MLTVWWFILCAVLGWLVLFFTPDRERISLEENRVLQNAPEFSLERLLSGSFSNEFESFLSDSIPGRKTMIHISDAITDSMAVNTTEDNYYLDTTMKNAADYNGDGSDEIETGGEAEQNGDDGSGEQANIKEIGKNGAKFELLKRDGGSTLVYTYPEENLKQAAENIEKVVELIPGDGNVYLTFVPFPIVAFRFTDDLNTYCGWQCDHIDKLDKLTSDRVKCFDTLKILEPHMLEGETVFLHVSHQWHIRGAYYVFSEMLKAQGLTPTPYKEYEYNVIRKANSQYSETDTFELLYPLAPAHNYQVSKINKKQEMTLMAYNFAANASYLHGDIRPWHTVITGFHTGRNALVLGDCFNLSFATFLLPYYDELHFTDVRNGLFNRYELGTSVEDMMRRNSIDDVYIVFSEAHGVNSVTFLDALPKHLY